MTPPKPLPKPLAKPLPKTLNSPDGRTFRASHTFTLRAGIFAVVNLALVALFAALHQIKPTPLFGALAIAFTTLYVSAATLQVTMDADGLAQRWIWGRRKIAWEAVASIERTKRGQFLLDEKNKEIFAVSALPPEAQQVIVSEAIKRARLRKDKAPLKPPVVERWVRK